MKHALRLGPLVLAMSLVASSNAEANWWDWLEELNGPGPSRGSYYPSNFMLNIRCTGTEGRGKTGSYFQIPDSPDAKARCWFVDQRFFHAEGDDRFYPVDITITEFGPSLWLHRAFEVGASIGLIHFRSENTDSHTTFRGARATLSFPRLVFRPILAISDTTRPGWGFLQIYFRFTTVFDKLDQGDFATKGDFKFERTSQRIDSMGFIIDFPSLGRLVFKDLRNR